MSNADELVKSWLLERFLWSGEYDKEKHGLILSIEVLEVESGWECGCRSEWTRDDQYELKGLFKSSTGTWYWKYGSWSDLPDFIEELKDYDELRYACGYEEAVKKASTTAEVLLYFGTDDPEFRKTVDTLRFITTPQMGTREIIELLKPVYRRGYYEGEADGVLQS